MKYIDEKDLKVHAFAIDETHIYIKCKKCKYHRHGSAGNLLNRVEGRSGHCPYFKYYDIVIDNDTIRGSIGRSGKLLKRSQKVLAGKYEDQKKVKELYEMSKEDFDVPETLTED